jgi:glycosyltransferase involved in cell wall biosynthesis
MITVSLVIPCYNEEINIQKGVLDRIGNFVLENKKFIEVLIIDDGSSDKSAQIVKEKFLAKYPIFRLVEKKHQGKALAVIEGIKQAKGEYVIFSDIDLATPLEEAHKIIREFEKGENVVIGSRAKERSGAPISRRIQSVGFVLIRDIFIGLNGIVDTQCGFKGFNTKVANKILRVQKRKCKPMMSLEKQYMRASLEFNQKEKQVLSCLIRFRLKSKMLMIMPYSYKNNQVQLVMITQFL